MGWGMEEKEKDNVIELREKCEQRKREVEYEIEKGKDKADEKKLSA